MRIEKDQIVSVVATLRSWGHNVSDEDLRDLIDEFDTIVDCDLSGSGQHRRDDLDPARWAAKANRKQLRVKVLIAFVRAGAHGLTNDELYKKVDPLGMKARDSWVPRVGELKRMGLIDSLHEVRLGDSGHMQTVHWVTDLGRSWVEQKGWL